ncbi:3994_t:CDS:1, partial [Dentiscutata erythropus]
ANKVAPCLNHPRAGEFFSNVEVRELQQITIFNTSPSIFLYHDVFGKFLNDLGKEI